MKNIKNFIMEVLIMNKFEKYSEHYRELMDAQNQFNKEHWRGNLILFAVAFGVEMGVIYLIANEKEIKNKFKKITSRKTK